MSVENKTEDKQKNGLKPLISIVVPIYNSEEHLHKCIDSIRKQTYDNIEIILVNDGSTDNSLKIARNYEKKDPRIIVINQKNSGGVITRRNGIKRAKGDYVIIEDSDDWLEDTLVEECVNAIDKKKDIDIVKFGYICEPSKKERNLLNDKIVHGNMLTGKEVNLIIERLLYKNDCNQVWNEMVKKNLYDFENKVYKEIVHKGEDLQINLQIFQKAKKVVFLGDNLYHYVDNPNGITNDIKVEKIISNIKDIIYLNGVRKEIALKRFGCVDENALVNKVMSLLSGKIIRVLANSEHPNEDLLRIQNGLDENLRAYLNDFASSDLRQSFLRRLICTNIIKGNYLNSIKYRPICKVLKVIGRI